MSDNRLLSERRPSAAVTRALVELAEHRMLAPARSAGYELRLAGATVLPQRQTIARTKFGTWLFVDHADDPAAAQYRNRVPIPTQQLKRLAQLDRAGVRPELVWIGHQLPDTHKDGDPLTDIVPPPLHLRQKDESLKLWMEKLSKLFKGVAEGLVAAGAGLDPIILGGVKHPELPFVQWCLLAQWEWE
jgi:hypothetical protein